MALNSEDIKKGGYDLPNKSVDYYRTQLEHEMEKKLLAKKPDYIFTDNPIIMSFLRFNPKDRIKDGYISDMLNILYRTDALKIPFIGMVDNPQSKSVCRTIQKIFELEGNPSSVNISELDPFPDIVILDNLLGPFDRTTVFLSRNQILKEYNGIISIKTKAGQIQKEADYGENLCFYYMRSTSLGLLRVEFSRWIYEANLVDELHKIICAQCILGRGYPAVTEQAHNLVVIRHNDQQLFARALIEAANNNSIYFRTSSKEYNKFTSR